MSDVEQQMPQGNPMPGQTLAGRYRLEAVIGQGGMATVFRAHDLLLDRTVAIKRLSRALDEDASTQRRFLAEARSTAALLHPAIVTLHDALEVQGENYLIMEYVEGQTLRTLLRDGPVSGSRALTLATDLADALAYAHGQRIVHGDIKPENVLVTIDGRPKLVDFGIARQLAGQDTAPTTRFGTTSYMAPEQLQGEPPSVAGDIFALGLVLSEMVTGQLPLPVSARSVC
jgi:eukaryotic-like serine/threonine-protein kinase